ncbi:MAG TPA: DUF1028 domain-containing protein [Candidatus Sulfotelmatobacter sp.]|nr:DUF1028 domain-containing protein [Candidatus Sulfotelmatobacter sp.]
MVNRFPFAHTFSIVARDASTGQLGVAVQSHWFSVGGTVPWAEAGVGAVATQAFAEPEYGPKGLDLLRRGAAPEKALADLLKADDGREVRQVGIVDSKGRATAHTGARCMEHAGHSIGPGFTAQANMMAGPGIWQAMAEAYEASSASCDLAERLLRALEAAQRIGGDIRGQQSACILVVSAASTGKPWQDRLFDLRVEDSEHPIEELRRLVGIQRAYASMNAGDAHLAASRVTEALAAYGAALDLAPSNQEIRFWSALTMADGGMVDEALPALGALFDAEPRWREVLRRMPATGLLRGGPALAARILDALERPQPGTH